MDRTEITVDGKYLGSFPSSRNTARLGVLKGIEIRKVSESKEEREQRLTRQREKRRTAKATPPRNFH